MPARVPVWDAPVRLFHWELAILVVCSFVTGTLLLFRLAWGVVGSSTARFSGFVRGPRAALGYARALVARQPPHHSGHNPLGGWMVVAMLLMLLVQVSSGLFADDEISTQGPLSIKVSSAFVARMNWVHEFNKWVIVAAASLHVIAIATYQWGLKVNLIGPMVHGGSATDTTGAPRAGSNVLAAILLAVMAGFVYWLVVVYPRHP